MNRTDRISGEIKKEISRIIREEMKDPRLPEVISIISVNVTRDLRYAKVSISVFGGDKERLDAIEALRSAAGFIRRAVGQAVKLRYIPELQFEIDKSIEHGVYISKLINKTMHDKT